MKLFASIVPVLAGLVSVPCMAQDFVWDYGPQTGPAGGCWANTAESQNFAELVVFNPGARVVGYQHFTCIDGIGGNTFEIKFLADDAGTPGAEIARFTAMPISQTMEGDQHRYDFEFDGVFLDAGSYWV